MRVLARLGAALPLLLMAAACGTPAPTPSATPAAPSTVLPSASGWSRAQVELPSEIVNAASDNPVFCSPCHPILGTYPDAVVHVASGYVALGYLSPPARAAAWTSTDASSWQSAAGFPGGDGSLVLAATATSDGAGIVAVGASGHAAAVWRSPDGRTWTLSALPAPPAGGSEQLTAIVRLGAGYVAGGYVQTAAPCTRPRSGGRRMVRRGPARPQRHSQAKAR